MGGKALRDIELGCHAFPTWRLRSPPLLHLAPFAGKGTTNNQTSKKFPPGHRFSLLSFAFSQQLLNVAGAGCPLAGRDKPWGTKRDPFLGLGDGDGTKFGVSQQCRGLGISPACAGGICSRVGSAASLGARRVPALRAGRGGAEGRAAERGARTPGPGGREGGRAEGPGGAPGAGADPERRKGGVRMACGTGNAAKRRCRGSACGCGAGGAPQGRPAELEPPLAMSRCRSSASPRR